MADSLTIDRLVLWLTSLGIAKVDMTQRKLHPEVAKQWRESGDQNLDPDRTSYTWQAPEDAPHFTIAEYSADDTGGKPVTAISVHPWRDEVPGHSGSWYSDGCIGFAAQGSPVISSAYFGQCYSGAPFVEDLDPPNSIEELQKLLEDFKPAFKAFCDHIDSHKG